jgi:hypothetical protein
MATTYEPIATTTLGSATNSVTFSSISGSYTDLILITSTVGSGTASIPLIKVRFNGDTGSNYSYTRVYGYGTSSTGSDRSSSTTSMEINDPGNYFNTQITCIAQIQNYSNSTTYKTMLARSGEQGNAVIAYANLWRSTSAVTSITIFTPAQNFNSGSTFTLYGIKAA